MRRDTFSTPELPPAAPAAAPSCLDRAPLGEPLVVRRVLPDARVPERARQLEEIGFYPGEQVMVMTRGIPGGDPLVVRVGQSTFALRGAEAACVQVEGVAARTA
ncbi:ferrous iron transport protein A [Ramlibacter sp. USB13]|uniref:Ferrous iron transport protein A n=1 Tax=Ramlibacter cellulosilyticus TaxID=2764187 RepID=A0A923MY61_9BURK|nr:FeoA family protein [Ramlibacter cellulosilyticus]MBC5785857.1 ferrous iron transport protein A [Ramlibacter cellulosilyticus]